MQDKPYSQRILELAEKWANGTATGTEEQEFIDWYNQFDDENLKLVSEHYASSEELKNEMLGWIRRRMQREQKKVYFTWRKITAAAAILFVMAMGSYFAFFNKQDTKPLQGASDVKLINDVKAPEVARASLQLADGSIVYLDSVQSGSLAIEGNVRIDKTEDGQLVYTGTNTEVKYNTLTNPKGSKAVPVKLSDGTMVWLNAASSLRYPVAFTGDERRVEITGEAYFEVKSQKSKLKNGKMPFFVESNGMVTEVLGTHFNVNAYENERDIKVTLLEGKVKVSHSTTQPNQPFNQSTILKPGQQAVFRTPDSRLTTNDSPDLEQVMAWKNGIFKFNGEDLQTIMKQMERWYNVEVVYEGIPKPLNFGGVISRKENASAVLDLMALTKQVKFRIEPSEKATAKIVVIQ